MNGRILWTEIGADRNIEGRGRRRKERKLMPNKKISIVLPAYNEAGNIVPLLEKIERVVNKGDLNAETILINDGSTDDTGDVAHECESRCPSLKVYDHKKNLGLTKALMTGFDKASGNIIIFLCSDLQSDPEEDIPKLLDGIDQGADLVVGWRQGRKESKRFGSKLYNATSKILFGVDLHDQNWIKAFRKEVIDGLILRSDWHRFLTAIALNKGYKVIEVKTNWYPRTYGESKYGFTRIPIAIMDMLVLKLEMLFIENPMKFFGGIGMICFFTGAAISAALFLLKYAFGLILPEYTRMQYFLVSILLILLGVGTFSLGMLGEFMVSYFEKILNDRNKRSS